jgi:hypothetical protein
MTEGRDQETGKPEETEWDPATLSSAEDLDEDNLDADPLEAGMDPPEHWSGVDRWGTTAYEQSYGESLDKRVAQEEPDVGDAPE